LREARVRGDRKKLGNKYKKANGIKPDRVNVWIAHADP
jgi:hypothetical protein